MYTIALPNNLSGRNRLGAEIFCSYMPESVIRRTRFMEKDGGLLLLLKSYRILMTFIPAEALDFFIGMEDAANSEAHEWISMVSSLDISKSESIYGIAQELKVELEAIGLEKVQVRHESDLHEVVVLWSSNESSLSLVSIPIQTLLTSYESPAQWSELINGIVMTAYTIIEESKKGGILNWRISQIRKGIRTKDFIELTQYALATIDGLQAGGKGNNQQFDIVMRNEGTQPLFRGSFPSHIVVKCSWSTEKVHPRQIDDFAQQIRALFSNPSGVFASLSGFTTMSLVRIIDLYADQRVLIVPISLSDIEKTIKYNHSMSDIVSNRVTQVIFGNIAQIAKEMTK